MNFYNLDLVGGDTSSSINGLMLSITAMGFCKEENIVYRSGAQINDIICVSGTLGGAYSGLCLLEQEKKKLLEKEKEVELQEHTYIIEKQLKPEARIDIIDYLSKNFISPTSMIDISDSLSSEVIHICTQSNVGARIYENKIPISEKLSKSNEILNISTLKAALYGGEDYELLFTITAKDYPKIKSQQAITPIGYIQEQSKGIYITLKNEDTIDLKHGGWDHFKKNN